MSGPTKEQNLSKACDAPPTLQGCGLGQVGLKAAGMGVRDQAHLERPC